MKAVQVLKYVVAMTLVVHGGATMALDGKTYGGNSCVPGNYSYAPDLIPGSPHIMNLGAYFVSVTCPIVRDNLNNTTGTSNAKIYVQSDGVSILSCTLYSHDKNGVEVANQAASTSSAVVTALNVSVGSSAVDGNYSIECNLPPGGSIYSYKIVEF